MIDPLETEVTKLARHLTVLSAVIENEPIGIVRLADETGYPKHKVRYSLRVLEEENLVEPTDHGAVTTGDLDVALAAYRSRLDDLAERLEHTARSLAPLSQSA